MSIILSIFIIINNFCLSVSNPVSLVAQQDTTATDEAMRLREEFLKKMEAKNKVGEFASDFRFITRDGSDTALRDVRSNGDLLLIFYDPDCDDCHDAITRLDNAGIDKGMTVVAIDSEEDKERWEETSASLPDNWIVGFATDPVQEDDIYYIPSMPTIYLLDKDKKVVLKETDADTVIKRYLTAEK